MEPHDPLDRVVFDKMYEAFVANDILSAAGLVDILLRTVEKVKRIPLSGLRSHTTCLLGIVELGIRCGETCVIFVVTLLS